MSRFQIKRRKADILYSQYLRELRPICERCFRKPSQECSHFWSRSHESTRFDLENTDALCHFCHADFTSNPGNYTEWKHKRMGEKAYKVLMVRAHTTQKRDDAKVLLWLKVIKSKSIEV